MNVYVIIVIYFISSVFLFLISEISEELEHLWKKIYKDEAFMHGVISVNINDVAITPEQAEHGVSAVY